MCVFLTRYLPLVLWTKKELPDILKTMFKYVVPSVLAGIVMPALFFPNGPKLQIGLANPYFLAGIMIILITFVSKRVLLSSFLGMGVFFIAQWILRM